MRKTRLPMLAVLTALATNGCGGTTTGTNSLVELQTVDPGTDCAYGGTAIRAGRDTSGNGLLEASEVERTSYVCNGADGSVGPMGPTGPQGPAGDAGTNGSDGASVLLRTADEPVGGNCPSGGLRVETGVDVDGDGVLDDLEVTDTDYVCATSAVDVVGFRVVGRYASATGPAAEIVTATPDGRTVVFTNGIDQTIEILDIQDPASPRFVARISLLDVVGHVGKGSVTSVAVTPNGRYAIAAVLDANDPAAADPGALAFVDLANPSAGVVGTVAIGVGPDSLHITPDGLRAVIAVEDEASPSRSGSIQIVTIDYASPSASTVKTVALAPTVGNNLGDLQPEFVDISRDGTRAIVSLQENNLVAVVDLTTDTVINYIDAGTTTHPADVTANGEVDLGATFSGRREPDTLCFLADGRSFVSANEGDTSTSGGVYSGGRGFSIFGIDGALRYDSGDTIERLARSLGQYPDSRSGNRGIEVEGCATGVFGANEFAFLLGERNSSVSVVRVADPAAPELLQMLPAPFRPEGAVTIGSRNLLVVAGEGPNGGAANDAFLGGGIWIYQGVLRSIDARAFASEDVLQGHSETLPFGAVSSATWNGVDGEMVAVPDVAFARNRIWTFRDDGDGRGMSLASELLLNDLSGAALSGYDPEGIAMNPEGGYVLATEGTVGNGGSTSGACNGIEKQRNRILFFTAAGNLDPAYGGGDGIVDLPCAATSEPNGIDWTSVTGNGFEGVEVVDTLPASSGGLRVYVILQRPLTGATPSNNTRIGEYDVDSGTWRWFYYLLDADLVGARNAIVLSEIRHIGDDEFAILERDQRRTGSSSVKRIYRVRLSSGTPNDPSNPVDKVLAVDFLTTPFRFDFEKVESIAITPRGTYVINDNDGGDEGVFFYRFVLPPTGTVPAPVVDGGVPMDAGVPTDAGAPASSPVRINEVLSTSSVGVTDRVELFNPTSNAVDVSGFQLYDSAGPSVAYTIPNGTTVPAMGYLVFVTGDSFGFGLGSADSITLVDTTMTVVDTTSWSAHVSSSGRCPDGTGAFVPMTPSFGSANVCP